jgi:redox-sensitive bicupin YhaK (pirin superfamily)
MPEIIIEPREADLGHGLTVKRILPFAKRRMVGPFIFLDHAGPVRMDAAAGRKADVRPHPHIGLSTLSYLLGGAVTHRDSLGVHHVIRPGEVNWMTAGRGIVHSERFDAPDAFSGNGLELLQSWIALPDAEEECDPAFENHAASALPTQEDGGVRMRLIAGEAFGLKSPVGARSPLFYVHLELSAGARFELPAEYSERALYVAHGAVEVDELRVAAGSLPVFGAHERPALTALEASTVMLLGGEPVGPRHIWWNFVSSRKERIEQAKADWQAGRFTMPPDDREEFIPLPA